MPALVIRITRLLAWGLLGCVALFWIWAVVRAGGPPGGDFDRIWLGALRIRAGQPLYVNVGQQDLFYTWAPWLAWIFIPLTFLPKLAVEVAWLGLCMLGWAATLWPARRSLGLLLLVGPLTFFAAWSGNVQTIMTAALVFGVARGWGPIAVGIAASLKVSPILFALPWIAARQWTKAFIALGVAVVLGAPAFLFGIEHYPFGLPPLISLRGLSVPLWIGVILAASAISLIPGNTRYGWLTSAVAVMASRPSLLLYDTGYLLVGLEDRERGTRRARAGHAIDDSRSAAHPELASAGR